jgi:hypothetical protein
MGKCVHEDYEVQFDPVTDEPEHVICAQCHGLWPVGERIKFTELALDLLRKPEADD